VVNDRVDLPAQLGIQRGDHVVDQPGADLLGLPGRLEQFGDKRFEALTGDGISLVARLDARRFHQLIQQGNRLDRLAGRARCLTLFFAHGLFLVLYAKFREQTLAGPVIVHQGLQLLAKLRQVTHRPFQGLERIPQGNQLLQLGNLGHDGIRLKIANGLEGQRDRDLLVLRARFPPDDWAPPTAGSGSGP